MTISEDDGSGPIEANRDESEEDEEETRERDVLVTRVLEPVKRDEDKSDETVGLEEDADPGELVSGDVDCSSELAAAATSIDVAVGATSVEEEDGEVVDAPICWDWGPDDERT